MKPIRFSALPVIAALLALASCGDREERIEKKEAKGFALPRGDADDGKAAFVNMQCHRCHTVAGVDLPEAENRPEALSFELGGEVRKVKTYGELVTAIVFPQHIVSEKYLESLNAEQREEVKLSPMLNHNQTMTVQQLIDLVTFLHLHYEKAIPDYDPYLYDAP